MPAPRAADTLNTRSKAAAWPSFAASACRRSPAWRGSRSTCARGQTLQARAGLWGGSRSTCAMGGALAGACGLLPGRRGEDSEVNRCLLSAPLPARVPAAPAVGHTRFVSPSRRHLCAVREPGSGPGWTAGRAGRAALAGGSRWAPGAPCSGRGAPAGGPSPAAARAPCAPPAPARAGPRA
jgi:hypothetical protein